MAILRSKEIRKLEEKDLKTKIYDLKLELAKERANIRIGASVTSPGKLREIRKTIARIETIRREKRNKSLSGMMVLCYGKNLLFNHFPSICEIWKPIWMDGG